MQSGVAIGGGKITGTLKYIADYTAAGFDMSNGNHFLVLHYTGDGTSLYVKKGNGSYTQLGADGLCISQITDAVETITVKATKADGDIKETTYTLNLTLEEQGE